MSNALSDFIEIRPDLIDRARQKFNITKKEIEDAIVTINEWFKTEPYLPKITPDPKYVEKQYIYNKGNLERVKQSLDLYYSLGSKYPELFSNRDPLLPELQNVENVFSCAVMPNLTENGGRIQCMNFIENQHYDVSATFKRMMMVLDLLAQNDFSNEFNAIFDLTHFSKEHKKILTKEFLKIISFVAQFNYLFKLHFHFVYANPLANDFIHYLKSTLRPAQYRDVWIHSDMASLHKVIDKKYLPKDFGGTQKSIIEIENSWWTKAKEFRSWFLQRDQYKTDESKRIGKLPMEKLSNILPYRMTSKNIHKLIEITPELKQATLKKLNLTQADIDKALLIITKWFVDQPHLPDIIPDPDHVERLFVVNRGNIENTKNGLDLYYTLKTFAPEIFANRDPLLPELRHAADGLILAYTYPLTPAGERVLVCKFLKNSDLFHNDNFLKLMFMEFDLRMRYDYTSDIVIVVDIANIELGHMKKQNNDAMKKLMFAAQGAFNFYVKEIHYVNAPSHALEYVQSVKQNIKPDFPTKVYVTDNMTTVYKSIPKSVLPSDFGGDLSSIAEMHQKWYDELIEMREFFLKEDKHIVDESKRVDKSVLDILHKL